MKTCACGCGKEITRKPRPNRLNLFIHGHHRKNIVMSEEQKRKIGISNSRPMSKKQRKLLSKIKKEGFASGKYTSYWKNRFNPKMKEGWKKWNKNRKPLPLEKRKNGGRVLRKDGYIYIFDLSRGYHILEHRYVMEKHLKRKLFTEEAVHHIDFDKTNNSIDNLILFPTDAAHSSFHQKLTKFLAKNHINDVKNFKI